MLLLFACAIMYDTSLHCIAIHANIFIVKILSDVHSKRSHRLYLIGLSALCIYIWQYTCYLWIHECEQAWMRVSHTYVNTWTNEGVYVGCVCAIVFLYSQEISCSCSDNFVNVLAIDANESNIMVDRIENVKLPIWKWTREKAKRIVIFFSSSVYVCECC